MNEPKPWAMGRDVVNDLNERLHAAGREKTFIAMHPFMKGKFVAYLRGVPEEPIMAYELFTYSCGAGIYDVWGAPELPIGEIELRKRV